MIEMVKPEIVDSPEFLRTFKSNFFTVCDKYCTPCSV